ncbi:MAG TPA: cation diffusion facilitator family transporter [Caulobacteraceae bacterium]|nr:cation diffusion facilitator family transporter [Caulobacteraceae bacterium]
MSLDPAPTAAMDAFRGDRTYLGADHARNEQRTRLVAAICAVSLVLQVAGGYVFNSMALTAGGLHMAAHLAALVTATVAYGLARRFAADPRFSFGTGKLGYLAGFANAVALAVTALVIGIESVERLIAPEAVEYGAAVWVAVFSLGVNTISAVLLRPRRDDQDLNIGAAYLHLSADVIVSGLAIAGLLAGRLLGWGWADPAAGLIGAALVARFAWSLIRRAAGVLLDMNPSEGLTEIVRQRLTAPGERLLDLHLWRLGPGHDAVLAVVEAENPQPPQAYRQRLAGLPGISHITVEVRPREGAPER